MNEENDSILAGVSDRKVLLAFGAKWCGPWALLQDALQSVENEGVEVIRVDVDSYPKLSDRYAVVSVPTFIAVNCGKEVRRRLGAVGPQELKELGKALK